ncbi:MAG: hypothetical protein JXO22_11685 [Phycisphaerae bacterium]|nr:hypothetical protein [Phycisphaerae bacterium]
MPKWLPLLVLLAFAAALGAATTGAPDTDDPTALPGPPHEMATPPDSPATRTIEFPVVSPTLDPELLTVRDFTSVQVNVNAQGLNIVGDAANEPSLAIDPTNPNNIIVGWRQFDDVSSNFREAGYAYSHDGGQTWTFPGKLAPDTFHSDPVLATDLNGTFYYYGLGDGFVGDLFRSNTAGVTWLSPTYGYGGDKIWLAIDRTDGIGQGNLYAVWQVSGSCCGEYLFTRSIDGGDSFIYPVRIPSSPRFGVIDVGVDGKVFVAGTARYDFDTFVVAWSGNAQNPVIEPGFATVQVDMGGAQGINGYVNPEGLSGQVWVATDHSNTPTHGNVYLLSSVDPTTDDPLDVHFSRSTDGGITWSPWVRINDDSTSNRAWQWFGTISVAPNGRIDVIWNDTREAPNPRYPSSSRVYRTYSFDGGETWAANEPISPAFNQSLGYPNQDKLGDYYDMISDNQAANLAYAATFNGEQDVYFLRFAGFDCNGNGTDDAEEIALGTATDLNGDAIPDDCQDCNGNNVPDELDISGGTSLDCNGNYNPDECELASGLALDCNGNSIPDECDIAAGASQDCNSNAVPDECDIAGGTSTDSDGNGVPDECEDCNANGVLDQDDISAGTSQDCNENAVPDECDLAAGTSIDTTANGIPDDCEITPCLLNEASKELVGLAGDYFAVDVAMSGDVAIAGAYGDDDGGTNAGAAYLYRLSGENSVKEAKLKASDGSAVDLLGFSVDVDGDAAIAGAYGEDDKGSEAGAAYIFRQNAGNWPQQAKLLASDGAAGDQFGYSVAIAGDYAIVGSPQDDDDGSGSGSAYVFFFNGANWIQQAKLTASDGGASDGFGYAVALDGDAAVIGAYRDDDTGYDAGAAYVFRRSGTSWTQESKLLVEDGNAYDHLGTALAISGDVIVVCASDSDFANSGDGQAYVFRFSNSSWIEEARLRQYDNPSSANLGSAVAIEDGIIVVGAHAATAERTGAAYVMLYNGQYWTYAGQLGASDATDNAYFGHAVAIANQRVLVGAPQDGEYGDFAGALYAFGGLLDCNGNHAIDVCEIADGTSPDCNSNNSPDACDIAAGISLDENENGVPDECESSLGDVNCDGATDIFDIDAFVLAITDPAAYAAAYQGCNINNADCNQDNSVDVFDIDAFVAMITGG